MRASIIVAVSRNGVIGREGGLAWKISDDLKHFKNITAGHPIVMGRKTFESIGKPLSDRVNIVVSRGMPDLDGVVVARGVKKALDMARSEADRLGVDEFFIIGGAKIYEETLPVCERIYLTEVHADVEGDAFFPPIDLSGWRKRRTGGAERSSRNEYGCGFFILDRLVAGDSAR